MAGLFPDKARPSGEESELLSVRLAPIINQMQKLQIHATQQPSVLFSLLKDPARKSISQVCLMKISLKDMIDTIKRKVLYEGDIQYRRINCWSTIDYNYFRRLKDTEEKAKRECIEFMTDYQKDLPEEMRPSHLL